MFPLKSFFIAQLVAFAAAIPSHANEDKPSVLESITSPGVSVKYKETKICETTPGVKSYAGYVNLPANSTEGRDYDIHTFFWFFEARNDPANAPLSLWLQGGPGTPSIPAALGENGPCYVTGNSKDTVLNPWSWNNHANMLYIDQPVQVGFSYDSLIKGIIDEVSSPFGVYPAGMKGAPALSDTVLEGKFPSQDTSMMPNTTSTAAIAAWQFMQVWMKEFPQYRPNDDSFSIWTESYGGHYGPTFSDYFNKQNELIDDGAAPKCAIKLKLNTLGIVNGCLDVLTQAPEWPRMANKNTYGIKAMSAEGYKLSMSSIPKCQTAAETCQSMAYRMDPQNTGTNTEVNKACQDAFNICYNYVAGPYAESQKNVFDITASQIGPFPYKYAAGYLNSEEVQKELGVPLNFTGMSGPVSQAFNTTGDFVLGRNLAILGDLVDQGVKVALVYGDRDYQCNWYGGEKISLAIQSAVTPAFHKAGYADVHTNKTHIGGAVRQSGNLSFTRVFDAGHEVPWYQPETAYKIFKRVMTDKDVATGKVSIASSKEYSTTGPKSVDDVKSKMPTPHPIECYFWDIFQTCTPRQTKLIGSGQAIFKDFIMVGYKKKDGSTHMY